MNQPDTRPPSRPSPPPVGPTTAEDYRQPEPMAPANFTSNTDGPHLIFGRPIENPTFKQPAPVTADAGDETAEEYALIIQLANHFDRHGPRNFAEDLRALNYIRPFVAAATARLAGELAEAKEQFQIQQKNYLNLCAAILGEGTFVAETDPFKAVARMKSDLAAARADAAGLREKVAAEHAKREEMERELVETRQELISVQTWANTHNEDAEAKLAAATTRADNEAKLADALAKGLQRIAGTTMSHILNYEGGFTRCRVIASETLAQYTAARSGRLPAPADGKE